MVMQSMDLMINESLETLSATMDETVNKLEQLNQESLAENGIPFGISRDWSKATPSLGEINYQDPLVEKIMKRFESMSKGVLKKASNGDFIIEGLNWGMVMPDFSDDNGDSCCFTSEFTFEVTGHATPVRYLCYKDCRSRLDYLMEDKIHFKQGDLINRFQQLGWSYSQARDFMAWYIFAYIVERHIVQGMLNYSGQGLRPFAGVAEMMSSPAVTPIDAGGSVIGAFRQVDCFISVLDDDSANYAIFGHKLTINGIKAAIQKDRDGNYPEGWSKDGNSISFRGIPFYASRWIPYDLEKTMTGELYIIDLNKVEAVTQYDLFVPQSSVYNRREEDPNVAGCEVLCTKYENFGAVVTNSPISHILVANVPLDATCPATVFTRIQNLLTSHSPYPMATIPTT